jgi:SAM-dependent methyltransferase
MTAVDRPLRLWRESKLRPYLHADAHVLDIGCGDGTIFRQFRGLYATGIGIDPRLEHNVKESTYHLIPGTFPESLHDNRAFNVIAFLRFLSRFPARVDLIRTEHRRTADEKPAFDCDRSISPSGRNSGRVAPHRTHSWHHARTTLRFSCRPYTADLQ